MAISKEFFSWNNYVVRSDSRDVLVDGSLDFDVIVWCKRMGIDADIHIKLPGGPSIWRIKNDEQRTLFYLRWDNQSQESTA